MDLSLAELNSPIVIFCHGFKGFKDWGAFNRISQTFSENGISFLKFNFSHNGTTENDQFNFCDLEAFGNNNFSIELDDLKLVIDWVEQNLKDKVDVSNINLLGHSRGGGLSILKANEDSRINKVASWASVGDFSERMPKEKLEVWRNRGVVYVYNSRTNQQMPIYYQFYEDYVLNQQRLDIPSAAKNIENKVLVVHGTQDETVDFEDAVRLNNWMSNSTLFEVEGADHVFNVKHPFKLEDKYSPQLQMALHETISFFKD